jgi:N6-adenosine-specific RNA methylase IME4
MSSAIELPPGPFGVILADPPWNFRTFDRKKSVPSRTSVDPYATMTIPQLSELPVGDVAAKDCVLFLWTVSYLQDEATEVARAWGFKPKSLAFVWQKGSIGMGYWTRQQVEICKLYTRGKPRRLSRSVRQLIIAPRREHSRKPDEQYERIEALAGGPYLELFARQQRPGWSAWGNQTDKFSEAA